MTAMWELNISKDGRAIIAQAIVDALPQTDSTSTIALATLSRAIAAPGRTVNVDEDVLFTAIDALPGMANIVLSGAYDDAHAEYWGERI